jgi:uracil-DNA glycosylase
MAHNQIVILGDAFSFKDQMFDCPFVDARGRELALMLADAGLCPKPSVTYPSELEMARHWTKVQTQCSITLTNVFMTWPPNNNLEKDFFTSHKEGDLNLPALRPGAYLKPDLNTHLTRLYKTLADLKPNIIICLGNTAAWALLGKTSIASIRGTVAKSPINGIKVLPTYHPGAVLGQWPFRPIVVADLIKARKESHFPEIRRTERYIIVNPSLADIAAWSLRPATRYAIDIETALGQISMISFARSAQDAICIPFHKGSLDECLKNGETLNYWPNPKTEVQAWKLVQRLLSKPIPKIFQNGIYDLFYLFRSGMRPKMCGHDTMLLHHSIFPEMQKSLGFLGSIYCNEQNWKEMGKIPSHEVEKSDA